MAVISLPTPTARRSAPTTDYAALERAPRAAVPGDLHSTPVLARRTPPTAVDGPGPDFLPRLSGGPVKAIVQKHCHQHAVLGFDTDLALMERVGIEAERPDSGCCGPAGNFGMTPGHREVSQACAEQGLRPAVREAAPSTLVLADGFSCRTQIDDAHAGKRPMHLAEVLNAAVRGQHV